VDSHDRLAGGLRVVAERDRLVLLDFDPDVVGISSQPFWLFWTTAEGKARSHAPDYFARLADGSALVLDVRAADRIKPRDQVAFVAGSWCCLPRHTKQPVYLVAQGYSAARVISDILDRLPSNTARPASDHMAVKKFAREVAVSTVSALILAGLTRVSDAWPGVVAKFEGNGWAAGASLTLLLGINVLIWWFTWDATRDLFSNPSKFEGWAAVRDNMGMGAFCLMFLVVSVFLSIGTLWVVFGTW
jgi:hypothetical protein